MKTLQNKTLNLVTVFVILCSTGYPQQKAPTAEEIIARIQKETKVPWTGQTVDVFKTGNPETPVTGIVTTMFATMDILKQAVSQGCNLIITHEPTFYNHLDDTAAFVSSHNPIYAEKRKYIDDHNLVIWRFHDHIHMMQPDEIIAGVVHRLGWEKYEVKPGISYFVMPETSVRDLAATVKKSLGISMMRVIGDPDFKVTKVAFAPGAPGSEVQMAALAREDVEVLLIGESREWETVEYARDAVEQGKHKAMIILGHVPSEEAGMEECALWLKTFVTEVPVKYIQTPEPFWVLP
jgi:putative NIF3 family GTP cyclohydrolase 1 type 2